MAGFEKPAPMVVGVENNQGGRLAVRWAAKEADRRGLRLRLVHALDWPLGAERDPDMRKPWETWSGIFRRAGERALEEARSLARDTRPGLRITEALVDGRPAVVMREQAASAAMVVLGSRRLSSARELMSTGNIVVPVIAHAACPVAVVRAPEHRGDDPRPLNPEAVLWGRDVLKIPIHDTWWQTETGCIMIANFAANEVRPGSMGRPVPGATAAALARGADGRAEVVDGKVTTIDEPGVEGELALRAGWPSMFRG
ncbi:universal stress protein [Embleya sp. NPDC020630]|uniref:universal stress protein n=1 Tax=Embleya sp. NPDC020630 TaxID=3363979 RepID=UPI0037AF3D15